MALLSVPSEKQNLQALQALGESKDIISYYFTLPQAEFEKLRPELQDSLNRLRKLYEYEDLARKSLIENTPTIPVGIFASRYYRWLRGEPVPKEILDRYNVTGPDYVATLFAEWCSNVGRATMPVWVVDDNNEKIYLMPPLHCREMVSIKEQVGFITKEPDGEHLKLSGNPLAANINKVQLLQSNAQQNAAMRNLFDQTVSVNGVSEDGPMRWLQAWKDAIIFFDKAFGLEPLDPETKEKAVAKPTVVTGYTGKADEWF